MFYLKNTDGNWKIGNKIYFPDGTILSKENKKSKDGWEWHENPPAEYLEWKAKQDDLI